jgi:hypothetical protein
MDDSRQDSDAKRAPDVSKADSGKRGNKKKAKFEPPKVITYSGDDILEELGPAHACSPFSGSVVAC